MPRPSRIAERREQLLPIVAAAFAELGYRRTTVSELAERCGVRENILYRLWRDKKAMFIASIDHVYDLSAGIWRESLNAPGSGSPARRLLEYEAHHHGEYGLYRIIFAGLSEADDPEIRAALRRMYQRFQRFIATQIVAHRGEDGDAAPEPGAAAWAIVGLGTVANIGRELGILTGEGRRRLLSDVGLVLLEGTPG